MKNKTKIYYAFCSKKGESPRAYKRYQRELADRILAYGFRMSFGVTFDRRFVMPAAHGKPIWKGPGQIYFNITNTEGLVACAVSDVNIGVDAERIRKVGFPVLKRCCKEQEIAYIMRREEGNVMDAESDIDQERFFQLWTLKESYIKMTGEGMRFSVKEASFVVQAFSEGRKIACSEPGFFEQRKVGAYWISACMQKETQSVWQELLMEQL